MYPELCEIGRWRLRGEAQRRRPVPPPSPGPLHPGLRLLPRASAVVLLSAFAAFLAAPFVHAGEAEGRYCAGDRCCCAPDAAEGKPCFRSVCRCGTAAREAVIVALGEAVLPASWWVPRVETVRFHVLSPLPRPPSPPLSPPSHPPPAV